jgi:hypothetical protein
MIKKLIILAILGAAGYVGYLVWSNLSEKEKADIKDSISDVAKKGHEVAKDAADKITDTIRDKDDQDEDKKEEEEEAPAEKPPPVPDQPGKIKMKP